MKEKLKELKFLMKELGVERISPTIALDKDVTTENIVDDLLNYFRDKKINGPKTKTVDVNEYFK